MHSNFTAIKTENEKKLMQAAVITAPGKIEMQTTAIPEPGPNEIRIRLEGCGVCASDLSLWQGKEWFSYPAKAGSPGHEGWGIIDAVGKDVKTMQPGYKVTGLCYNAYAEYDICNKNEVVEIPDRLRDQPFPGEPLGCAINIFERSEIKRNSTVAIIGIGWLGSLLVQLAKSTGAEVIALSRRESSLERAKQLEADHVYSIRNNKNIVDEIENLTNGNLCDCVIEAAGKQEALDLASKLTAVRGRLIIAGYHQDGNRRVDMQLWNWRGIDVINAHERDPNKYIQGIRKAERFITEGTLNPFPLFTHTFDRQHIDKAFRMLQQKPEGFTKALIKF
jgi:threonine dehydrogenase-like Zn-dependent dehydrogenase